MESTSCGPIERCLVMGLNERADVEEVPDDRSFIVRLEHPVGREERAPCTDRLKLQDGGGSLEQHKVEFPEGQRDTAWPQAADECRAQGRSTITVSEDPRVSKDNPDVHIAETGRPTQGFRSVEVDDSHT